MESVPKAPAKIHVKNGTVITNRQLIGERMRTEDFDAHIDDRTGRAVGVYRTRQSWKAGIGWAPRARDDTGLVPRPCNDPVDPLVSST